jgi:hypothetical protein
MCALMYLAGDSLLAAAFYLDLAQWAVDGPGRWAQWAVPCPIKEEEVSCAAKDFARYHLPLSFVKSSGPIYLLRISR